MDYITMICDIKNSKALENREELQYRLIDMLKAANGLFSDCIASQFIITTGDEWQGLLKSSCDYGSIIEYFREGLAVDFYCGIGIGEVKVHNFELTVNQLDGPSFHKARNALRLAKQNNYSIVTVQ